MVNAQHIRIFVSSPGDVAEERKIVFDVIKNYQDQLLREGVILEAVAWDLLSSRAVLRADMTPQEAINQGMRKPAECDIVLVIFWSRMGTPLPHPEYRKADGSPFLSGTDWEYWNAIDKAKEDNHPLVVVYRRTEVPTLLPTDPDIMEKINQWNKVKEFFDQFQGPGGALKGGINQYETVQNFSEIINIDLGRLINQVREAPSQPPQPAEIPVATPRVRVIGKPPISSLDIFKGRQAEVEDLINVIRSSRKHTVVIHGQKRGSGKTALACRIMERLDPDMDGLIYLSSRNIDLEHIFLGSARILGGETEKFLTGFWAEPTTNIQTKIERLLEYYTEKKIAILLDDFEAVQNDDGEISNPQLKEFLLEFLGQNHNAVLLITCHTPVRVPADKQLLIKEFALDYGLLPDEAKDFIRELDPGNELRILTDSQQLQSIVQKTQGFPRAIQSIVGILTQDPLLKVGSLLDDTELFTRAVVENLVREAELRLDQYGRYVVYMIAIYQNAYPDAVITQKAIEFMLKAHWDNLDFMDETLRKLARGRFIKIHNREEISLHPLDASYYYHLMETKSSEYDVRGLNRLAADFYAQNNNNVVINSIENLDSFLAEFEHRVRANQYDAAALVLNRIDPYLLLWGHAQRVFNMRNRIASHLEDSLLAGENYGRLGRACRRLARWQEAETYLKKALSIAEKTNDELRQGQWLGELSINSRYLSDSETAIDFGEKALEYHRRVGNTSGIETALGNLGIAYRNRAEYKTAIEYLNQALDTDEKSPDRGNWFCNLGISYMHLGEFKKAVEFLEQALSESTRIGDKFVECISQENLGYVYCHLTAYEKAQKHNQRSLEISRQIGDLRRECNNLAGLATICHEIGELATAEDYSSQSIKISKETKDVRRQGAVLGILGRIYVDKGKYAEALDFLEQGLKLAVDKQDRRREGRHMSDQGVAYRELGEYDRALSLQSKGLSILQRKEARNEIGHCVSELGQTYGFMQDFAEAKKHLEQSVSLAREFGQLQYKQNRLSNLAVIHLLNDDPQAASMCMREAVEDVDKNIRNRGSILTLYAVVRYLMPDHDLSEVKSTLLTAAGYLDKLESKSPDFQRIEYIRMVNLAMMALCSSGDEQKTLLQKALQILQRSIGENAPGLRHEYLRILEKVQDTLDSNLFGELL